MQLISPLATPVKQEAAQSAALSIAYCASIPVGTLVTLSLIRRQRTLCTVVAWAAQRLARLAKCVIGAYLLA